MLYEKIKGRIDRSKFIPEKGDVLKHKKTGRLYKVFKATESLFRRQDNEYCLISTRSSISVVCTLMQVRNNYTLHRDCRETSDISYKRYTNERNFKCQRLS